MKTILIDTSKIDTLTTELKGFEKEVGEAVYHALSRTLDQVVTHVGRIVPKEYAVKSRDVKESFKGGIKKPTRSNLTASLTSKGHLLSFAHFPFTPKTDKRFKKARTVMVTIKKPKGKIPSKTGFVASTGAKSAEKTQYNVFHRLGKERYPIAPIRTLSIPQMISNEELEAPIQEFATNKLSERLEHEITRAILNIGDKLR